MMDFWYYTPYDNNIIDHTEINSSDASQTTLYQSYVCHAVSVITFDEPLSVRVHLVYSHHVGGGFYAPLTCTQP